MDRELDERFRKPHALGIGFDAAQRGGGMLALGPRHAAARFPRPCGCA